MNWSQEPDRCISRRPYNFCRSLPRRPGSMDRSTDPADSVLFLYYEKIQHKGRVGSVKSKIRQIYL